MIPKHKKNSANIMSHAREADNAHRQNLAGKWTYGLKFLGRVARVSVEVVFTGDPLPWHMTFSVLVKAISNVSRTLTCQDKK